MNRDKMKNVAIAAGVGAVVGFGVSKMVDTNVSVGKAMGIGAAAGVASYLGVDIVNGILDSMKKNP